MKPLIITYLLTYGGVLAAFARPHIGFLVYVLFGIIKPYALWQWAIPRGHYDRIVAVGFLTAWLVHGCGNLRLGRGTVVLLCLFGYWLITVLTATAAPFPELAWERVERLSKVLIPVLAGATLIDSVEKLKQLVWVIVLGQGYLAYEFNLYYLNHPMFIPWEWTHAGLDNNGIAITMVTSTGMAFFLGLHAPRLWQRGLALLCAALMAHVVLFSNSRGGMLSLIVTGVVAFLLMPKRPVYMLLLCVAVVGVFATTGEGVQKRFLSAFQGREEGSDEGGGRKEHWQACLHSMVDQPLGVGPRHWSTVAPSYGLFPSEAHSTWLQTGAEIGIAGLACLLGYYLIAMRRLVPLIRYPEPHHDPFFQSASRMIICALVGFMASAQFVTLDGVELPYFIVLCGTAVLRLSSEEPDPADGAVAPEASPSPA